MTDVELLEDMARKGGVTFRLSPDDDPTYATVLWRSSGPVMHGCLHNRVLICSSFEEAAVAVEMACEDLRNAKEAPDYYNA